MESSQLELWNLEIKVRRELKNSFDSPKFLPSPFLDISSNEDLFNPHDCATSLCSKHYNIYSYSKIKFVLLV